MVEAKKDTFSFGTKDDPKETKAEVKDTKTEAKTEAKEEKKEEGHPRLARQLLDLIERIEERKTPFSQEEQTTMQSAVKRLSRTMGDYRAPE